MAGMEGMRDPSSGSFLKLTYDSVNGMDQYDPNNKNEQLGLLERPSIPPGIEELSYKILVSGAPGSGKSTLISWLCNMPIAHSQTIGLQTSVVYCHCQMLGDATKPLLFRLQFWEQGNAYHEDIVEQVRSIDVDCALLLFSFLDKDSFVSLPDQLSKFNWEDKPKPSIIACGMSLNFVEPMTVSQTDIMNFERSWKIPVLKFAHDFFKVQEELKKSWWHCNRKAILTFLCEQLYIRDNLLIQEGVA